MVVNTTSPPPPRRTPLLQSTPDPGPVLSPQGLGSTAILSTKPAPPWVKHFWVEGVHNSRERAHDGHPNDAAGRHKPWRTANLGSSALQQPVWPPSAAVWSERIQHFLPLLDLPAVNVRLIVPPNAGQSVSNTVLDLWIHPIPQKRLPSIAEVLQRLPELASDDSCTQARLPVAWRGSRALLANTMKRTKHVCRTAPHPWPGP
ncbi:uncharacterized protein BKCO1_1100081 [Diplodia corticola]|uniref:Uncharacterized protein n=1 Tax=Diplodia corticola TaxID=236234 RepID=A0A1J9R7M6_9PEZI|nr:uncharacterized protein BKCO1_1100081 [Diplodia corticola]OJD36521.1 hypothetical protein BKCO1_1100081 [Diplodia corticola]